MIDNRKYAKKVAGKSQDDEKHSETETLVSSVHDLEIIQSVTFNKDQYTSINFLPHMMNDLYRFCVIGNSVLHVDTTFELVDGLWLTDTTYTNEALNNQKDKHPEFLGPSFWHFKKTQASYRKFAGEFIIANPSLSDIKKDWH